MGLGESGFVALVVAVSAVAEKIDDHIAAELLAEIERDFGDQGHGHGSSPLTWKIGACTVLATSLGYCDERAYCGEVVKPIWLLTMRCTVPPTR